MVIQIDDLTAWQLIFTVVLLGEFGAFDSMLVVTRDFRELLLDLFGLEVGLERILLDLDPFLIEFL